MSIFEENFKTRKTRTRTWNRKWQTRLEKWNISDEDEVQDFPNPVMDMSPSTKKEIQCELSKGSKNQWKTQPYLDPELTKVGRNTKDYIAIANLLRCSFCNQFPNPKEYYFCENQAESHVSCKNCVENHFSICEVVLSVEMNQNQSQSDGCLSKADARKCGMPFRIAMDPLYNLMLEQSSFYCVYKEFRCPWTGPVDSIGMHAENCESRVLLENTWHCPITKCTKTATSADRLAEHLIRLHRPVIITKISPIISISLNWKDGRGKDRVWVPAIVRCCGLDILLTLEQRKGRLFEWLYVIESDNKLEDFYILSGFRDKMQMETNLREEVPEFLDVPPNLVSRKKSCFSISIQELTENHLDPNLNEKIGGRDFIFDLNIMSELLPSSCPLLFPVVSGLYDK